MTHSRTTQYGVAVAALATCLMGVGTTAHAQSAVSTTGTAAMSAGKAPFYP